MLQGFVIWSLLNYIFGFIILAADVSFFDEYHGEDHRRLVKKKTKFYLFFPLWGFLFFPIAVVYLVGTQVRKLWIQYKIYEGRYFKKSFIEVYEEYLIILKIIGELETLQKSMRDTFSDENRKKLYDLKVKEIKYRYSPCYVDL